MNMAALKLVPSYSVEELHDFLILKFDEDLASAFRRNKIAGSHFLKLSEVQFNQMVPAIGDVVDLQTLQKEILKAHHDVSYCFTVVQSTVHSHEI